MKILIENSGYPMTNMGDISMLQVAVSRLQSLWNNAVISVLTDRPDLLNKFCPGVRPLYVPSLPYTAFWFPCLSNRFYNLLPGVRPKHYFAELDWNLHQKFPQLTYPLLELKLKRLIQTNSKLSAFLTEIEAVDLVVATGGGYITDNFPEKTHRTLTILNLATWLNKPTIMLGQGLGPLKSQNLLTKAKLVLPRVNLIALREGRAGIPLLKSLGVSDEKVIVTGDDAIELAFQARSQQLGNGIGINLRVADYSMVDNDCFEQVKMAFREIAIQKNVPLIPIPIAHDPYKENDPQAIQKLLAGFDDYSDGGQTIDTPLKVIQQVQKCRVVVTGSYHAGVFALSQGIPIVGLAKSQYYKNKFLGLAEQFESGCQICLIKPDNLKYELITAINQAWILAEEVKNTLLESAHKQIKQGHLVYQKIHNTFIV
ncbi:unknown [Crocosphaera subtropica ATCC 51142]|uniref:Polysaccharide pyruvyl transferase domain-containing protein n=1 Tax=Crocosphaera subtropica (strain ATCC 51142 / BH68) TaxID=43989 RepID=B1WNL6_CROS5|nr:polysaccharide pyruvyl transferase family protein [Crocosphaera subtropica]ACB51445.1 unknown [Crocosphaera subtropica ATCC 51142]